MDVETAKKFQEHVNAATRELHAALVLLQDKASEAEFLVVRKFVGQFIAEADGLLAETVHNDHPQLDPFRQQT